MTIWIDLTNTLTAWHGGVVGIVRTELMLAKNLYNIDKNIRYTRFVDKRFIEVDSAEVAWLYESKDITQSYTEYQKSKIQTCVLSEKIRNLLYKIKKYTIRKLHKNNIHLQMQTVTPFKEGDVFFSCGWFGTGKEDLLALVKQTFSTFKIIYLVYDIVMIKEGIRHFYYPNDLDFEIYLKWISCNADFIIYCGETAQKDTEEFLDKRGWIIPDGKWIKFGSDVKPISTQCSIEEVEKLYGLEKNFILAVGSFEPRKNYKVLYQAYCMLALEGKNYPQLVIVGKPFADKNLQDFIQNNPITKEKIKIFTSNDDVLETLYKNCQFAVLPSLYEGRSVVLSEILDHHKLCICSDVPPLRELGQDLVIYADPKHPKEWAELIMEYTTNSMKKTAVECKVKEHWKPVTWHECAGYVYDLIKSVANNININRLELKITGEFYYDYTLFFYRGGISGIPRAQLLIGRYLARKYKRMKFISFHTGKYMEIERAFLKNTLSDKPIDQAVIEDLKELGSLKLPESGDIPFRNNDVVFSTGVGFPTKIMEKLKNQHQAKKFKFIQLLYDFTPIIVPQTHSQETLENYPIFLKNIFELADYLFYGGETAQSDGLAYQRFLGLNIIPSSAIKFGSDFNSVSSNQLAREAVFEKYGITKKYLLSVGTIEARKNHDVLYEAFLEMLRHTEELPQLVVCGRPGWKTEDFRYRLQVDERIKGKIVLITPSDEELNILYRNCLFTLLASLYEGWSLTLPESLNYGKFCIASDTKSLHEVGGDLIAYANPYDPEDWAKKILAYYQNSEMLRMKEKAISQAWRNTTWAECSDNIAKKIAPFFS